MSTAPAKQVQSVEGLSRALNVDGASISRARPIHRRIVEVIDCGIALGAVAPGYRLSPGRELASALRVSHATIVAAYRGRNGLSRPCFREALAYRFGGDAANTLVIAGAQQGLDAGGSRELRPCFTARPPEDFVKAARVGAAVERVV